MRTVMSARGDSINSSCQTFDFSEAQLDICLIYKFMSVSEHKLPSAFGSEYWHAHSVMMEDSSVISQLKSIAMTAIAPVHFLAEVITCDIDSLALLYLSTSPVYRVEQSFQWCISAQAVHGIVGYEIKGSYS